MNKILENKFFLIITFLIFFTIILCNDVLAIQITLSDNKQINFSEIPQFPNENYNSYIIVEPIGSFYLYYLIFYDKDKITFNSFESTFYSNSHNFYIYGYDVTRYSVRGLYRLSFTRGVSLFK